MNRYCLFLIAAATLSGPGLVHAQINCHRVPPVAAVNTALYPVSTWLPQVEKNRWYCTVQYDLVTTKWVVQDGILQQITQTVSHHQYVLYSPKDPCWVYWYNPVTKVFWARCPTPQHPNWAALKASGKTWHLIGHPRPNSLATAIAAPIVNVPQLAPPIPEATDGTQFPDPPDLPQ